MIVFEVRSDGTVISTPSFVAQGISLSDLVVLADADYSLVTMHFTPPSGIYIPDVVFTPTLTQGRNLWQAVMPPEISRISGAVTYQIFLTSADGKTLPTPTGRITVQEGVISNMPETAEELGQYSISALYQLMSNFYASLEGYRQTLDGLTVKTHKWTILASDWTDSTPYQASIMFPHGNYAKPGTLILVAPADNRSREQIEKGGLTVTVHDSGVLGSAPVVDTAVIVRGGKAPTEDINLVLFFIDTQGEDEPLTQWIGIDMGSILPEATPEDDGKVLGVDGGVWQKVDIPDPLPPILPENESDALTVEGGAPVWKKNSWNSLTDKPFGDVGVTIEWDGDSTGKVTAGDGEFVKVSDLTPEPSDLIGGIFTVGESSATITADTITDCRADGIALVYIGDAFFVVYEDNYNVEGVDFAEKGVYAYAEIGASSLTYGTIKTIDSKYLPDDLSVSWNNMTDKPFSEENVSIEWDGNTDGKVIASGTDDGIALVKVSDLTPEYEQLIGGVHRAVTRADSAVTEVTITEDGITDLRSQGYDLVVGGMFFVCYADGVITGDVVFPEKGIYFYDKTTEYQSYLAYTAIKTIDPKYLPETESNIYTYDSLEQVPADLPEGLFVAVPSTASGGGLPVVEITGGYWHNITEENPYVISESEITALEETLTVNKQILLEMPLNEYVPYNVSVVFAPTNIEDGVALYSGVLSTRFYVLIQEEGVWAIALLTSNTNG